MPRYLPNEEAVIQTIYLWCLKGRTILSSLTNPLIHHRATPWLLVCLSSIIVACASDDGPAQVSPITECGSNPIFSCSIELDDPHNETIESAEDVDYYIFFIPEPGTVTIQTMGQIGTKGELYRREGNIPLIASADGDDSNFLLSAQVERSFYYIRVSGSNATDIGSYSIVVSFVPTATGGPAPTGSLSLADFSSNHSTPIIGQHITLSVRVSCSGDDCAPATLNYYSSTNDLVASQDTRIGSVTIPMLSEGQNRTFTLSILIGTDGVRYYGACIGEACIDNDEEIDVPAPSGSHSLGTFTINGRLPSPSQAIKLDPNQDIEFDITVRCSGGSCASTTLTYYRSDDDQITNDDHAITSTDINGLVDGGSQRKIQSISVEDSGTYYYGACIGNLCTDPVRVEIQGVLSLMDFLISNPIPKPSQDISLSVVIDCQGGDCPSVPITYYRSPNSTPGDADDIQARVVRTPELSHNEIFNSSIVIEAENSGITHYGACINNDCLIGGPIEIQGSLSLRGFTTNNSSPQPGDNITLSVSAACMGGPCLGTNLEYYLSDDGSITHSDSLIGTISIGRLADGGSSQTDLIITVPTNGTYYYGACLPTECTVGVEVVVQPPATGSYAIDNSLITDHSAPAPAGPLTLTATLSCATTSCSDTSVDYYLSTDSHINRQDDTRLGNNQTTELANNRLSLIVTTPQRAGIYYYGACLGTACTLAKQVIVTSGPGDDDQDGWGSLLDIDDDGDGLIEISSMEELHQVRYQLDGSGRGFETTPTITTGCGNGRTITSCHGYELDNNITLTDNWQPIMLRLSMDPHSCDGVGLVGLFEGNGRAIKNITIKHPNTDCVGLFGKIASASEIRNLRLEVADIQGKDLVGALVGDAGWGRIINVSVGSHSIDGNHIVGGLVGNGYAATIISAAVSTNHIQANGSSGGLAGIGELADIRGSSATTINLTAADRLGGLIGDGRAVKLVGSYAVSKDIKGSKNIGGLIGYGRDATVIGSYAMTDSINQSADITGSLIASPYYVGGLIGDGERAIVVSSYGISGDLNGRGNNVDMGGLVGWGKDIAITSSYAVTGPINIEEGGIGRIGGSSNSGGLIGRGSGSVVHHSYWDRDTSGMGVDGSGDDSRSSDELRMSTTNDPIYDSWPNGADISLPSGIEDITRFCDTNLNGEIDSSEGVAANPIWDFGTVNQYPAIRCTPDTLIQQRARWQLNQNKPEVSPSP